MGIAQFAAWLALAGAPGLPAYLPRYRLGIEVDVAGHCVRVRQEATWTNPHATPTSKLVFNAHARYVVPPGDIGLMAKTLEILRMQPSDAMGVTEPSLEIQRVLLPAEGKPATALAFRYEGTTKTDMVVDLPFEVAQGRSVTVLLDFVLALPQKQGRWGQWKGLTYLSNWLPVFAVYGEAMRPADGDGPASPEGRWQPVPYVPWHQPFFNEAGIYTARVRLPADHEVACSGKVLASKELPGGLKQVDIEAAGVREFTLLASARYKVWEGSASAGPDGSPVRVRIVALPEHEFYAKKMMGISIRALVAYSRWLGPYPYPDFTVAEAFFGWNGNECSSLVMIDERVFGMPTIGAGYVEYLLTHEVCHQWFYCQVGTNGYCETWMDEAFANHFCNRLLNQRHGKNNALIKYPDGLHWLPNINREDYRSGGMYGTFARGEDAAILQDMEKFGHLISLFNLAYDKGSRVVGMIEDRLGSPAFLDFMRCVVAKYRYRILRVADFRRELEAYTGPMEKRMGKSWRQFFHDWLCGPGLVDWCVEKVSVAQRPRCLAEPLKRCLLKRQLLFCRAARADAASQELPADGVRVEVWVRQKAKFNERTTLGFALPGSEGYPVTIPILPHVRQYSIDDPPARVTSLPPGKDGGAHLKIEIVLPAEPTQVAIDPEQVMADADPANNYWHTPVRWRFTPLYTFLEETDLTTAYDRWNVIFGPWLFSPPYQDAWFTRSTMVGARLGLYRAQQFSGGAYAGFRTDFRDVVYGVDGQWDHFPHPAMQAGIVFEQRLAEFNKGDPDARRAVGWLRYVFLPGSSLYLPPAHYVEGFTSYSDNFLPFPTQKALNGVRFDRTTTAGLHYRLNYLTPYWDPEGGFRLDGWYEGGMAQLPSTVGLQKISGQFSTVMSPPSLGGAFENAPILRGALDWFADTRFAVRAYGATSSPSRGEFFSMGGAELFRGFDLAQRQGSTAFVGSAEWRVPIVRRLKVDVLDNVVGLRNAYAAFFYDVGDAYAARQSVGPVAHGVGLGLRLDVAWFSFVERTTLRLDIAKAVNLDTGVQVWVGVNHPF